MNQQKRLKRRIILSSLMLIIICSIFSSQSNTTVQNVVDYNDTTLEPNSSAFEGGGKHFEITQHANAISSTFGVNPSTTAAFTLSDGWTADNILIEAENVTRHQDAVVDGTVQYLSGTYTYWTYNEHDTSGANSLNPDYRLYMLSLDVGEYGDTVTGDWAYFNQIVTLNDDDVSDRMVEFTFDYRIRSNGVNYWGTRIYAAVIVGSVEYDYYIGFGSQSYDVFHTVSLQYYLSDEGQSVPNDIEFRFGVYVNTGQAHQGYYSSDRHDVHFQNLEYNIWTIVNEPDIMYAEDNDDYSDYYYQNTSAGMGYFTYPGQKSYSGTQVVSFTVRDYISDTILIDNLTISADLTRTLNTTFSSFQDGVFSGSDDILWTFDASPSIPVSYTNRWFEIEKPDDWDIVSVVDPFLTNRTSSCTGLGYGTTKFTMPTSVFSSGDWQFRARSKSWFDDAKLEYWNGISFEEKTNFYVGEEFHVKVNINDTITFTNTELNFTIYHPNGTVFYELSQEPSAYEYYFGNFTIGAYNMSVGTYMAEVAWTNNLSSQFVDKVGYKTFEFNVIHKTSFTAVKSEIKTVPGEALLILVEYEDIDLNQGINLATVEYDSTFGESGTFAYAGGGYYFLDLDTSTLDYTDYYLSLNASKTYFDNHTEPNFIQITIEREGMILDVPRQVNSVSANSYALFDFNLTGEISEAFLTADDITTDWMTWYDVTETSVGQYELNVSTWDVTSESYPETFVITIYANKTNYSNASDVVLLQVNPIATTIAANKTFIEISQGTPFSVKVNLTDTGLGTLVSSIDCTATWSLGTTITPVGDEFVIDYMTIGLALDQYSSLITLNRSGYQTKSIIISVLINPVQTVIQANTTFLRVSQGNQFTVNVNYTEYYGGALIPTATTTCTVNWLKYYEVSEIGNEYVILFNTTDLSLDQYTATVQINRTGYETRNVFITVIVDPISTNIDVNTTLIQIEQGKVFSITANYTYSDSGMLISLANCTVTWERSIIITEISNEFIIDFDTTALGLGQYTALIQISRTGFETRSIFITVLIEPVSSDLTLLISEPIEFILGDQARIAVDFIVDGISFDGGTVSLLGDIEGDLIWNGTAYIFDFETSFLESKMYFSQIFAEAPGVQTQIYDLYIRIQPVEYEITLSSTSVTLSEGTSNFLYITIFDSSHGDYVLNGNLTCSIGETSGTITSLGNGTYEIDLNQFGLAPAINPYSLELSISNPFGEDETFYITIVVPRNWNLYWWIAGSVGGTILLGLSGFLIYYKYIRLTRFQRDVAFIKKNISNLPKIKSRVDVTREKQVLEIINKEIDQLL